MFEISTISNVLNSFALSLEVHDGFMLPREGVFGKSFDENSWPLDSTVQMMMTPLQFGAENARISVFLLTELPRLRNLGFFIAGDGGRDREYMCNSMGPFYITMKKFFDDRKVTTELAFTVLCWIKSVQYLQGNSYISRMRFYKAEFSRGTPWLSMMNFMKFSKR